MFFVLLAFVMASARFSLRGSTGNSLPQPQRFRIEMEAAVALVAVFSVRSWLDRNAAIDPSRAGVCGALSRGEQVVNDAEWPKSVLRPLT